MKRGPGVGPRTYRYAITEAVGQNLIDVWLQRAPDEINKSVFKHLIQTFKQDALDIESK